MIVKTIKTDGGLTLIEWIEEGQPYRAWVPAGDVVNGECVYPERGIPYGVDWSQWVTLQLDPVQLDRALKQRGIWTPDDLKRDPNVVQGAINYVVGDVLGDLMRSTRVT